MSYALLLSLVLCRGQQVATTGTLAWKRVELLEEFVTTPIMFISGALLPLDALPGWVRDISAFMRAIP
ncbi:MAG: hypothetical protein KGJ86_17270 [Chloroflexota bacterium]|nr:hypothetical protein [Chloroflexota bacterium]